MLTQRIQVQEETGATFIHPFDDEEVIAGQGTIGLEILDSLEGVDAVIVPVGGGGLISGVACAVKNLRPDIKVYGVQAAGSASMFESRRAGEASHWRPRPLFCRRDCGKASRRYHLSDGESVCGRHRHCQ